MEASGRRGDRRSIARGRLERRPPGLLARCAPTRHMHGSTKDFEVRHAPAAHEDDAARAVAADGLTLRACRTATLELIKQLAGRLEPHRERTLAPSRNGARRGRTCSLVRCPHSRGDRYDERRICEVLTPSLTSYEFVSSEAPRAIPLVGWMWAWRILFQLAPLTSGFYTSSRRPRPERGRSATARGGAGVGPLRAGQLIARRPTNVQMWRR